jgi:hypothetical protein
LIQGTYRKTETSDAFTRDAQCENQITKNPDQHQVGSESLVTIVHAPFVLLFRFHIWLQGTLHRRFELTVDIGLGLINFLDKVGLGIVLFSLSHW